jgi:hypothetical protein
LIKEEEKQKTTAASYNVIISTLVERYQILAEPASFALRRNSKEMKKRNMTDRTEVQKTAGRGNINHRPERPALNGRMPKEKVK